MTKAGKWVIGCTTIFFVVVVAIGLLFNSIFTLDDGFEDEYLSRSSDKNKIAVVDLKGEIFESEQIVRQLKKYRKDKNVKAIILRINSPGGDVAASQEIFEEVKKVRSVKPIVSSFASVAASGGYYVALGSTKIVSNAGSVTGSIGVISQYLNIKQLLDKVGIGTTTITSGKFKDSGSPYREATEEDKLYFKETIEDVYVQFKKEVSEERNLPIEKIEELANGKIFTGNKAFEKGLVDEIGTFEDAISLAAELAKIEGEPALIKERKKQKFFDFFFEDFETKVIEKAINLMKPSLLQYKIQYLN